MIVFKYLFKQVMITMLSVTLVLLMIFMSGRFIRFLEQAVSGGISLEILFPIMAYRLPSFLELILPLGFFIGILLAYGRMYMDNEMTVLHACGMSNRKLLGMSLAMSALVALIVGSMSLIIAPWGMKETEKLLSEQAKKAKFESVFTGKFQHVRSANRVIYIESLSKDKQTMQNVFISEKSINDKPSSQLFATSGKQFVDKEGDRYLILHNGTLYKGNPGHYDYQTVDFESYQIQIEEQPEEQRRVKEEAIPSVELLSSNDIKSRALLQWRISLPLLVPIVALIAVSISRVNPRQGRFIHLFPAMLLYVAYLGLLIVTRKSMLEGKIPEYLGLWSVHLLFMSIAITLFNKEKIKDAIIRRLKS